MLQSYFITGTGRCGSMLVSRALSYGNNTICEHEKSVVYSKLASAYLNGDWRPMYEEIDSFLSPRIDAENEKNRIYGECSGLLYPIFDELYRRYGRNARFVLLTRKPEEFVRSALARGFFDPDHPKPLEHLRARPDTAVGSAWETTSPFEKCLWYWREVNTIVLDYFECMPRDISKVVRMEDLNSETLSELYQFLGICGFDDAKIGELLSIRVNATPGMGDDRDVNPNSTHAHFGSISTWSSHQKEILEKWTGSLRRILYPHSA